MTPPIAPNVLPGSGNDSSAPIAPGDSHSGPPAQKPPSKLMKALQKGVGLLLLLIVALIVLGKFVTRNDVPGCQAKETTDTLSDIFKSRNVDVKRYDGFTTRSTDKDLIACTAALTLADNSAKDLVYEISRVTGGGFQVKVNELRDRQPAPSP